MTATEQPISALPLASSPLPISISSTHILNLAEDLCDSPRNERALRQGSSLTQSKRALSTAISSASLYLPFVR